jgi:hypothetical protein
MSGVVKSEDFTKDRPTPLSAGVVKSVVSVVVRSVVKSRDVRYSKA